MQIDFFNKSVSLLYHVVKTNFLFNPLSAYPTKSNGCIRKNRNMELKRASQKSSYLIMYLSDIKEVLNFVNQTKNYKLNIDSQ